MMRSVVAACLLLALVTPVSATESIICSSADNAASIDVLVGMVDVISIARASIEAGGKKWATDADGEKKIAVGQAFEDPEKIIVDFTDEGVSQIVASLRLFKASEGEDYVSAGTLRVAGTGAWAVTCSGP
jgi:hypothetical protein